MPQRGDKEVVRLARARLAFRGSVGMGPSTSSGLGLRVLVADDYPDTVESLQILLRLWGHEVATARDGVEALAAAKAFRPHVLVLDFEMPRLSGGEVAVRLRQMPGFERLVIVAATGHDSDEKSFEPYREQFDFHFRKPFSLDELEGLLASSTSIAELRGASHGSGT
jgi:CheY-like chemotaxis protein